MISVNEAKNIIKQAAVRLQAVELPLYEAFELSLSSDVFGIMDIPAFSQSSMDGYALIYEDRHEALSISGEMAAGTAEPLQIYPKQAVRIFTGAPLPAGADTVVMQEKVRIENSQLIINDDQLQKFNHVRNKGAEVKTGALAMPEGTFLSAAAIGFLAGIGITKVPVYPAPVVTIILTGNELQTPGKPLAFGQVYESNSVMLSLALKKSGIKCIVLLNAEDTLPALQETLEQALAQSDVVILTGGVSVGDYDFVVKATENCGVKKEFHKLKQKPGKPLFFGTKEDKLVFGLPGNPSSVLTCFYEYVLPSLEAMMKKRETIIKVSARITHDYPKAAGLTHFLKAKFDNGQVTPLHAQESFRLQSFSQADCLIVLSEESEHVKAGTTVEVHLLPV
jgi:molybdopterin molybdotransferase